MDSVVEPMKFFCDNKSKISLTKDPIQYSKSKHIQGKDPTHYINSVVKQGDIAVVHMPTDEILADRSSHESIRC